MIKNLIKYSLLLLVYGTMFMYDDCLNKYGERIEMLLILFMEFQMRFYSIESNFNSNQIKRNHSLKCENHQCLQVIIASNTTLIIIK